MKRTTIVIGRGMIYLFDNIIASNQIEYGILNDNNTLAYIKTGNGGNVFGYEKKYLTMAKRIHNSYGYTVIVASNPIEITIEDGINLDMKFLEETFPEIKEVYAFGHSNGGQMLLNYAHQFPIIKKVVAVNSPLMINLHKTKRGIVNYSGRKMIAIYGDKDPSYKYVELLNDVNSEIFGCSIIENADHNFTNMIEQFINLANDYVI